jgi:hypothetical protein
MDSLRSVLESLTDWLPSPVRGWMPLEAWGVVFLTAGLAALLALGLALRGAVRGLFGRGGPPADWDRGLREDLASCPVAAQPVGGPTLTVYHLPAVLRLVVLAPTGADLGPEDRPMKALLDGVVPGLGGLAARDKPRVRVWPAQVSHQGFVSAFHRCTPTGTPDGKPSRWVLVAGRVNVGRRPVLLGLGLWTEAPCTVGRVNLGPHQWLDVLRLRTAER